MSITYAMLRQRDMFEDVMPDPAPVEPSATAHAELRSPAESVSISNRPKRKAPNLDHDGGSAQTGQLTRSSRWERAMAATGILPLGGIDLHRLHPELWHSRMAGARALQDTPPPQLEGVGQGHLIVGYRRQGVKGRSTRALIDVRSHPDPRAALEVALGPLAWFEILEPTQKAPRPQLAEQPSVAQVTYGELRSRIQNMSSAGTHKRNVAALAEWRKFTGKTSDENLVGPELNSEHDAMLADFGAHSRARLGPGFANRMSGLKQVRGIYLEMVRKESPEPEAPLYAPSSFGQALKTLLKELGMTISQATRAFGTGSISPWTRDIYRLCTPTGIHMAQQIEQAAGRPGYLTRFAQHSRQVTMVADFSGYNDPYRNVHKRALSRYRADLNIPELRHIKEALDQCVRFKTMAVPPPNMQRSSKWSRNKEGHYPSMIKLTIHVEAFFGWLMLPPSDDPKLSGPGLSPDQMSFGLLGCQELTIRFLEFKAARVEVDDGRFWGGALITFEVLSSLCRKTGWLCQTEELWLDLLRDQLPRLGIDSGFPVGAGYFKAQHEAMLKWTRDADVDRNLFRLRDPWVTGRPFLDADSPMQEWIFPLIRNLAADRPSDGAPLLDKQVHERDLMTIVAFFAVPMRALNWRLCEVEKNLYRDRSGAWILHVTREEFKNRALLGRDFKFRIKIPGWAQPYFSHYIDVILPGIPADKNGKRWLLPVFMGKDSTLVACAVAGAAQGSTQLATGFAGIFERYFGYKIRPHAARHIVATDYLKADPRNLAIIAVMLNDTTETVRQEYASLFTQDYATPFSAHMDEKASRVLGLIPTSDRGHD